MGGANLNQPLFDIMGNTFSNCTYGIYVQASNQTIKNNNFTSSMSNIAIRAISLTGDNLTIEENYFYSNPARSALVRIDSFGETQNVLIKNNFFGFPNNLTDSSAVHITGTQNVEINNNTIWAGNFSGYVLLIYASAGNNSGLKVYNNRFGNSTHYLNLTTSGTSGYAINTINVSNGQFKNNTFYLRDGYGLKVPGTNNGNSENILIKKNNFTYDPTVLIIPNRYGIIVGEDAVANNDGFFNNTIIENNTIIMPQEATSKHPLLTVKTNYSIVRNNYVVGGGYGILSKHDSWYYAYNNTMENQTNFEGFVTRSGHNSFIYNNTFFCPQYNSTKSPHAIVAKNDISPARNVTNLTIHSNVIYVYNTSKVYSFSEYGTNFSNTGFSAYNNTIILDNSSRTMAEEGGIAYNFSYFRSLYALENNSIFSATEETPTNSNKNEAVGKTNSTINWTTQESANSSINYGTTLSLGSSSTNSTLVLTHIILLEGLSEGTVYYYNMTSCDFDGNCTVTEGNTFTTSVTPTETQVGGSTSATTYDESDAEEEGLNLIWRDLKRKDRVKFEYKSRSHSVEINSIGLREVKVTIASNPKIMELNYNKLTRLDIDEDDIEDIKIIAEKESANRVKLSLEKIVIPSAPLEELEEISGEVIFEEDIEKDKQEPEEVKDNTIIIYSTLAIIIILALAIYFFKKRKKIIKSLNFLT
jgi:parallel beta-helix repeat protein